MPKFVKPALASAIGLTMLVAGAPATAQEGGGRKGPIADNCWGTKQETRILRDHTTNPNHMAQMMVQLMRGPARQVYHGPDLPVHHFFPTTGTYKIFFECAPNGKPLVVDFMINVVEYNDGMDSTVRSIVTPSVSTGDTRP